MVTVTVPGGCNQAITSNAAGFLNYGDVTSSPSDQSDFHTWLVMPFSGNISGASVSINQAQPGRNEFYIFNLDTNESVYFTLYSGNTSFQTVFGKTELSFSSGDRLQWVVLDQLTSTADIAVSMIDLDTPLPYPIICASASLSGTAPFVENDYPYSFGSGAHNNSPSTPDVELVVPEKSELMAIAFSGNYNGFPIADDATINIYLNEVSLGTDYTVIGGTSVFTSVFSSIEKIQLFPGDRIKIRCANTSFNLNHSVITLFMQSTTQS